MEWITKHVDTVIVIGAIVSSMLWMNSRFNEVDGRFSKLEQDMAVMKAVLIMKNIMPAELAKKGE